eukprot:TRINITY_DN23963_c0_g1_i1.p1 TRINITY_DN23963_c0_g1~~TRINITY_DN23963_c0_g1_i1.p1  ORF type:complete len:373 (+),score=86.25 TRINITY_DN23963_c0_g1_i1:27-1145(+)
MLRIAGRILPSVRLRSVKMASTSAPGLDQAVTREIVSPNYVENKSGIKAVVSNWGGCVLQLHAPDATGAHADVVLGKPSIKDYVTPDPSPYFGCLVGRFGNRIRAGKFSVDGHDYQVTCNDGKNHLHGGNVGWDNKLWNIDEEASGSNKLVINLVSPDGEEGFPGTVKAQATVEATEDNALKITMTAETDKPTPINLTHHGYFNLAGHASGPVNAQMVKVHASEYTLPDAETLPTGELGPVSDFDLSGNFNTFEHVLGAAKAKGLQGLDHNFAVTGADGSLKPNAEMYDPASKRKMTVSSNQPGFQIWSANGDFSVAGKEGMTYGPHAGVCFEAQHFPDFINIPSFKQSVLRPGDKYEHITEYKFSVAESAD